MHKKITTCLALLTLLLCSCASGAGPATGSSSSPATVQLHAATSAVSSVVAPLSQKTANTPAPFRITSVDVAVSPATLTTWTCGSFIQVVYSATFHVVSGPAGGVIDFSYTINNGRSQTPERLTIIPGQHLSSFVWTWQGALPADHTYPGPSGVMVSSPNQVVSQMAAPAGACR